MGIMEEPTNDLAWAVSATPLPKGLKSTWMMKYALSFWGICSAAGFLQRLTAGWRLILAFMPSIWLPKTNGDKWWLYAAPSLLKLLLPKPSVAYGALTPKGMK